MKQKVVLLFAAIMVGLFSFAQKTKEAVKHKLEVPAVVQQSFHKEFPGAVAKWDKEGETYEANFKHKGKSMSALFEPSGAMTEQEVSIKISELPAPVHQYIKEHYKGAVIKEAARITKSSGEINYEAEVRGKDVIFDQAGKFIKETKD